MINIGQINKLKIIKKISYKYILDGGELGDIILADKSLPGKYKPGDELEVFIYKDRESVITATLEKPAVFPGEAGLLKVVAINSSGAFMDWGLSNDLFVPFSEQKKEMKDGRSYVVYIIFNEEKGNIIGTTKIEKYLNKRDHSFSEGEKVNLLIYDTTEMGYKAIINNTYTGVLYKNEIFKPVNTGLKMTGYIKKIREDRKIDLCLEKPGFTKVASISDKILIFLKQNKGLLDITDKSEPQEIYNLFGVSKSTYKKALGTLYKKKIIEMDDKSIRLIK